MSLESEMLEVSREAVKLGAAQIPDELRDVLVMLAGMQPAVLVEIGCYMGGSLFAWRRVCERVYGITLTVNYKYDGGRTQPLKTYGAEVHEGDSHEPASREWLESRLDGSPVDVLVLDADHRFDGVKQDLMIYGPLVRPGGLILLHDVLLKYPAFPDEEFQVWRLWEQLRERYETFVIGVDVGWGVIRVRPDDVFVSGVAGMQFKYPSDKVAI